MDKFVHRVVEIGRMCSGGWAIAAVSCLVLTMACSTAEAQSKGKSSPNPKVEVDISSLDIATGDEYSVVGDGAPYRDGVDGVEAQIWRGGSEDMTLRLYKQHAEVHGHLPSG